MILKNHQRIQCPNRLPPDPLNCSLRPSTTVWLAFHLMNRHTPHGMHSPSVTDEMSMHNIPHPKNPNTPPSKYDPSPSIPTSCFVICDTATVFLSSKSGRDRSRPCNYSALTATYANLHPLYLFKKPRRKITAWSDVLRRFKKRFRVPVAAVFP